MPPRIPQLRLHKPSGQGYVYVLGRMIYLGRFDDPETAERHKRFVAEWKAHEQIPIPQDEITVTEVLAAFWKHAEREYRGKRELENFRIPIRAARDLYGRTRAVEFGPRALKTVRQEMIEGRVHGMRGVPSRTYLNRQIGRLKFVFKWAVEEELIPPSVHEGLLLVSGLRRGRSEARETSGVRPVPQKWVDGIEPHVSREIWAIVQLQILTAARPGELVVLRRMDIDTSKALWEYRPRDHKNAHRDQDRVIFFGPHSQRILQPFLRDGRGADAFLFSAKIAEERRRAALHARRKTPLSCGNRPGTNRRRKTNRKVGERYTVQSYRIAIHRGCDKAGVPRWSPNQLRHNAATHIRHQYGYDAAQAILGHKHADTTQIYADLNLKKAADVAAKIG